jgi:hypothetical protein
MRAPAEERQRVDRKAQRGEGAERADQRYGHDQNRNQRRAPALQEQVDDEYDEHERNSERLDNFFQATR